VAENSSGERERERERERAATDPRAE
jgi:hypothetical protein